MIALQLQCPDENQLVMAMQGLLTPSDREAVEQHIDGCPDCRAQIAQFLKDTVKRDPGTDSDDERSSPQLLPRGTNLGRYVLLDCIGRGGMAIVYSAYDPELDRKVAVKLLRTDLPGSQADGDMRGLMLREAQAMARLSHPNVIAVHDVGTFGDQVFLAMEFVQGQSLRQWLKGEPRSWREILQVLLRAGEGLHAAHLAGLVHGDFKPDNVLVGPGNQVRVTDFGLSRPMRPSESGKTGVPRESGSHEGKSKQLVGTPLYFAPEQWRGAAADERTDQFSYCVTLYEALYGVRPDFAAGAPDLPTGRSAPHWVRRVILRGLSVDPVVRYPSMVQLLDALSYGLKAARYRRWMAAAVVAFLALGFASDRAVHVLARRKAELDMERAVGLLQQKWQEELKLLDLTTEGGLKKDYLIDALGKADNLDSSLGLSLETPEQGLVDAHEIIRSADLSMLKSEDALVFVDASGRVVYNQARESSFGEKPEKIDLLSKSLSGEAVEALWSPAQVQRFPGAPPDKGPVKDLLLIVGRPVARGSRQLGAVLLGRWVGASFLQRLEQAVGDRIVLGTLDGTQVATLEATTQALKPVGKGEVPPLLTVGPSRYLVQSSELSGLSGEVMGEAFVLHNYDQELEPLVARFRKEASRLGAGALALAAAAYAIWATLSRPRSRRATGAQS